MAAANYGQHMCTKYLSDSYEVVLLPTYYLQSIAIPTHWLKGSV